MHADATTVEDGTTWSASVCIVGAGPAGLTLAESFREVGIHAVLLDRAGLTASPVDRTPTFAPAPALNAEAFAATYAWGIGGTATVWNTIVADESWAKYVALDASDLAGRSWVPDSGWPLPFEELARWYGPAHRLCGTGGAPPAGDTAVEPGALRVGAYVLGPSSRFRVAIPAALRDAASVRVVHGAMATGLLRSTEGHVTGVRWRSRANASGAVHADVVVLAAGALENARLLLDDRAGRAPAGPGSAWLGRGFMEHPIDRSLRITAFPRSRGVQEVFDGACSAARQRPVVGRIGFDPALLAEERLPNMSLRAGGEAVPATELPALRPAGRLRSAVHRVIPSQRVRRLAGGAVRGALERLRPRRPREVSLVLDLEQWPRRENGIVLTEQRGAGGVSLATVRWVWRPEEEAMRRRAQLVVKRELERAGLGEVRIAPGLAVDPHAHHHAGTTRMHEDPEAGVVDATLRVHGEENLYVAGASVFPTAGVANPTLTIVALALRLGEHLRQRLGENPGDAESPPPLHHDRRPL